MILIEHGNQQAVVNNGELTSYRVNGYEYMHQAGNPGWGHSDIEMFPVIGPTAETSYRVQVPRGNAIQDQHGMLREMQYEVKEQSANQVSLLKNYSPRERIKNSKYPERSSIEWLIWPFNFEFRKSVILNDGGLTVEFRISGERDMPFMLGYHPAFNLRIPEAIVQAGDKSVGINEVLDVGNRALLLENTREIVLQDERKLTIKSSGFRHFMLWTEVTNMICIEPITFYPYAVEQHALHEGFDYLAEQDSLFSLSLCPEGL